MTVITEDAFEIGPAPTTSRYCRDAANPDGAWSECQHQH